MPPGRKLTKGKSPHALSIRRVPNPNPVRVGHTVNVQGYHSVTKQLELTWKDVRTTASGSVPGMAALFLFGYQFMAEKNIDKNVFAVLCLVNIYRAYRGPFVSEEELAEFSKQTFGHQSRLHKCLTWLMVNLYLDAVASKDGVGKPSKGRYYFVTVKGQELINDYHNLCVEEFEKLIKYDT